MKLNIFTEKWVMFEVGAAVLILTVMMLSGCDSEINPDFIAFENQRHPFGDNDHYVWLPQENYPLPECFTCHTNPETPEEAKIAGSCSSNECHPAANGPIACNNCHWAGAEDLNENRDPRNRNMEIHYRHVTAYSGIYKSVECSACHTLPTAWDSEDHIWDETPGRAEVNFNYPADARGASPVFDDTDLSCSATHCHGSLSLDWQPQENPLECGTCHGIPPAEPHLQGLSLTDCINCHESTIDENGIIIAPEEHVNGTVSLSQEPLTCSSCHWADGEDLVENRDPQDSNREMHFRHVTAYSGIYQPVDCEACHTVPETVYTEGHIEDDTPGRAEITFGFPADALESEPVFNQAEMSCSSTHCHGSLTMVWQPRENPLECGTCHGIPPDEPHASWPTINQCNTCHGATINEEGEIIAPETHVNGQIFG